MKQIAIAVVMLVTLSGSACSPPKPEPGNSVAVAACPAELPAMRGDTFGDTATKLVEVAGIYFKCRCAALGCGE